MIKHFILFIGLTVFSGCSSLNIKEVSVGKNYKNERLETLPNGLKVYFIQDESLPVVDFQLLIPVGASQDPVSQEGLYSLTARLLDKGTQTKSALEIADAFADVGSDFSAGAGHDFLILSTQALITQLDPVLNLTSDVLFNPIFPDEEIIRERQQMLVQLKSRKDRSGSFAETIFAQNFFGGHKYGDDLLGNEESLKKIQRKDIQNFYKKFFQPQGARLAVTGKLNPEIENKVRNLFSKWPATGSYQKLEHPLKIKTPSEKNRFFESPHKAQTEIRMALPGLARSNKDFLSLRLINEVLGGSFASRLNQRIRDDLGLTYSIYSYVDARDQGGAWVISTSTKNESAEKTISEIRQVLQKFYDEGISLSELEAAKNLIKAQLPRALETSDKLGFNLIALDFYGVDKDYLINFNKNVDEIKLNSLNQILKKYLKISDLQTFVFSGEKPNLITLDSYR
ncbi:MAG: M16 family metallopeptidase [Bdellovibrionales bacterium]